VSEPLKVGAWGIPANWTWIDVASVADTTSGGTPRRDRPEYYGGRIPWLKSGELRDRTVFEVEEYITEEGLRNSSAKVFPPGTLCIALYGATVGKLAILGVGSSTNQAICGIFPAAGVDARFLFRFFELIRPQLIELGKGGAQPNISQGIVRGTFFPLSPANEQQRVVAEIDKQFTRLEAAVAALRRVQANLKRYRAAVLKAACEGRLVPTEAELARKEDRSYETGEQLLARILKERRAKWEAGQVAKMAAAGKAPQNAEWKKKYKEPEGPDTSNLPKLPEGWTSASPDQLSQFDDNAICAGPFGTIFKAKDFRPHGIPIIFLRHVASGRYLTHKPGFMDRQKWETLFRPYSVFGGELLITKLGEPPGVCAIYPENAGPAMVTPDVIKMSVNEAAALPKFLMHSFNGDQARQFSTGACFGTTRLRLTLPLFRRMPVALPPLAEQGRILTEVERQLSDEEALTKLVDAQLFRADRLRKSLLKSAFKGKLVPQDPNDEPASVLLERIRAERCTKATEVGILRRQRQRRPTARTVT
jgi:type I restriction enzyme S subunit